MMSFEEWIQMREPQYYEDLASGEKALYEEIYSLEQAVLENSITSVFNDFIPFLEAMEEEYLRHYPAKGESWKQDGRFRVPGSSDIYPQFIGRSSYLRRIMSNCFKKYMRDKDPSELLDIANLCGMLWLRTSEKNGGIMMYKVKVEGIGPLSYISKDRDSGHDALKLEAGETAEVEFKERLWVWGSPFNPARCNVIITPIQSSDETGDKK